MTDWTRDLSDYLDGELSSERVARLESEIATSAVLRATLEDLRAIRERAGSLEDRAPASDLWPGIRARLESEARSARPDAEADGVLSLDATRGRDTGSRRFSFSMPQLAAASIALLLLGSSAVWVATGGGSGRAGSEGARIGIPAVSTVSDGGALHLRTAPYEAAIRDLELRLEEGRSRLDTTTVRVVEESLAKIDSAIDEARTALAGDPGNVYLNKHLAASMERKLEILRRASSLAAS